MSCEAKIRPMPNDTEIECGLEPGHTDAHSGVLRDYAFPGSATTVTWYDDDRRNFRGEWMECPERGCILPAGHPRGHAS